jgi:putative transposase
MDDSQREGEAPAEPRAASTPTNTNPTYYPQRKHPTHGIKSIAGQPTIIFDTLCLKRRQPILACDDFHRAFREVALCATAWRVGRYVVMPDHIHFFAGDHGDDIPYENWIKYLKSQLTKQWKAFLGERGSREGEPPAEPDLNEGGRGSRRAEGPYVDSTARQEPRPPSATTFNMRWLTDHWDTRVRSADAYEQKWQYVLNNPIRAGLVARPEDWPFHGEIYKLRW